jgi:16S rRNA C1402 N4-methylase RsmH
MIHRSVLLHESIDNLNLAAGKIYFDGTLGAAGHAQEVFAKFGDTVEIISTDKNESAVKHAENIFAKLGIKSSQSLELRKLMQSCLISDFRLMSLMRAAADFLSKTTNRF